MLTSMFDNISASYSFTGYNVSDAFPFNAYNDSSLCSSVFASIRDNTDSA